MISPAALHAIRAWYRLHQATTRFAAEVQRMHGVSGEQLALLRIVAEARSWTFADLRGRLTMHPATLGQALDRLDHRGLVEVAPDPQDRRRRSVAVTADGRALLEVIPLAGPVRLRDVEVAPERLERMAAAFEDAVELFGLEGWAA